MAYEAEVLTEVDMGRARALRQRARNLYLRGARYGFRALERNHPGLERALVTDPTAAAARVDPKRRTRDVPLLYWTAAALGLAISVALDDAALLARLPEVEALIDRALVLDEAWDSGSLHQFKVTLAGGTSGRSGDRATLEAHYTRALELSKGGRAGLFVAYAEAVALPAQDKPGFQALLERAIAVDPDLRPRERLATLVSQRRARWLLGRIDDLILSEEPPAASGGAR